MVLSQNLSRRAEARIGKAISQSALRVIVALPSASDLVRPKDILFATLLFCLCFPLAAQQTAITVPKTPVEQVNLPQIAASGPGVPLRITLRDAIKRAKTFSPTVQLAITNAKIAAEKPLQTRSVNLPIVSANSQYLYTQGNGTPSARYIANNGVHEYIAQGDVHQALSLGNVILYRQSIVAAALSRDQKEIAMRGLTFTVVTAYAILVAANDKYAAQQQATVAAQDFLQTTQQLESGGEVAHADVVKAQIQYGDSQVALQDAELARDTARAALAILLFPDVRQNYDVADDPANALQLPSFAEAETEARHNNPSLDAAFKAESVAKDGVDAARAGYLPAITLDYFYGIDANRFAMQTPSNLRLDPELHGRPIQNLGYSALASLTIPVWNWGETHSKVKSAKILLHQADLDRQYAERKLVSDLDTFYGEAKVAKLELGIRQTAALNAAESQKLTLMQYKAGQATALEVVNAQNTLTLERTAFADAETRYAAAIANLATLTGNL
ncbi:MAG: TolC family protein [Acidobacteriaceae bacterium]